MQFYKFQANGNDFILVDDRKGLFSAGREEIARFCNRHFGIGADGFMLLKSSDAFDFDMLYFNSDGKRAEMCGNGGRSIAALAYMKGVAGKKMRFSAADGVHEAKIENEIIGKRIFDVSLKMEDVREVKRFADGWFLNTGVPHFVKFISRVEEVDVAVLGREIRNDKRFAPDGTNVNFVGMEAERLFVRTYERGVEVETLSCGTGVTASALTVFLKTGKQVSSIHTHGGDFRVSYRKTADGFEDIWLRGPAERVFDGELVTNEP